MYPPFARLFHGKSTRRALHQYRIGSRFKFRSSLNFSSVDGETVVLHSEDYKFILIYLHILKTDFHLLRDIMSPNDDLLPVGRPSSGLTLETSAFQSLYGGQFTLSTPLINQIFVYHSPTDAAPQFL